MVTGVGRWTGNNQAGVGSRSVQVAGDPRLVMSIVMAELLVWFGVVVKQNTYSLSARLKKVCQKRHFSCLKSTAFSNLV